MISAFKQAGSVLGSFGTPRGERCALVGLVSAASPTVVAEALNRDVRA
jgi:hypothetical protein